MSCSACDQYDTEVLIRWPGQLARVIEKIRIAVSDGVLHYNAFESDRELVGQPSLMELDLSGPIPDVMRYRFQCPLCGSCYGLFVETYHGAGGKWSTLKNTNAS